MRSPLSPLTLLRLLFATGLLAAGLPTLHAQDDAAAQSSNVPDQPQPDEESAGNQGGSRSQQPHELSDKVSEGLQSVQKLVDAKDYNGAIAQIDTLLPLAGPTSYDLAILSATKAQIFFQKNDYMSSLDSLETALKLGDTYGYFDAKSRQQFRYILVSLYSEKAQEAKDPAVQSGYYDKARAFIERWLAIYKKDPESHSTTSSYSNEFANAQAAYASLLFNIAERDPHNPDRALIQKALDAINVAMHSTLHPSDSYYGLQLAAYQQLGNFADAATVLELILKSKPDNKTYWQQLTAFYLNLAGMADEKQDDALSRQYYIRAILSMERAQQHGAMNTPKDNFRLVSLYFNVGQYEQAAEILENGLHNGTIDSTPENWKTLAAAYQQSHKDLKAVEILREAAKLYPQSGQYDFLAAQILYGLNDTAGALKALQTCVAKDGGDKPAESWRFLIYLAFELQKFDLAGDAIEHYAKYPEAKPKEVENFREAVKAALEQRERANQSTQ
ncbi:MAG TPA: hypothetical protein VMI53_01645 [Opitutaceae bacterium]|nr:hypothetical protein [Opitutaceae bacterium]